MTLQVITTDRNRDMSEEGVFFESIQGKSAQTQKSYRQQYKRLASELDKDIHSSSQKKIIEVAGEQKTINTIQARLNIAILVRRLYKYDVKELEKERDKNKERLVADVKQKNTELNLPDLSELYEFTEYLYENGKWTDYIINFLLLEFQVRNKDLNFTIVKRKRDAEDEHKNYIWLDRNKAIYIRRDYKTVGTYGIKTNTIYDVKFLTALRNVLKKGDTFIPNEDQVGYYVKKATYKELGEGAYMKIMVNAYRDDLQKLRQLSTNRGTHINTIASHYDVSLQ